MKIQSFYPGLAALTLLSGLIFAAGVSSARAATYTWDGGGSADYWGDSLNWHPDSGFPNAAGDVVTTAGITITPLQLADSGGVDASFTVGSFTKGHPSSNVEIGNVTSGTGKLIFQGASGTSAIVSSVNTGKYMNFNVGVTLNDTLEVVAYHQTGTGTSLNFLKTIDGSGSLSILGTKVGSASAVGYVNVNVAASYTGSTTINGTASTTQILGTGGGKLVIAGSNFLPTATVLSVNASSAGGTTVPQGGRFNLNGFNQEVAGLNGSTGTALGTVTNDTAGASTSTLTINNAANHVYSGVISDAITGGNLGKMALAKSGAGTQTLAGANTYTGVTTVTAGTLLISGDSSAANGAVAVNGGKLYVSGTLGGNVTLASGATIGNVDAGSLGTGTVGNIAFDGGSFLDLESLTSTMAAGTISFANTGFGVDNLRLNGAVIDWSSVGDGTYTLLTGTLDETNLDNFGLANAQDIGGGRSAYFQEGSLQLVVIPEPRALLLAGAGMMVVLFLRRRRSA